MMHLYVKSKGSNSFWKAYIDNRGLNRYEMCRLQMVDYVSD